MTKRNFCLYHHIQTGSGTHPATYLMDARVKQVELESDLSLPTFPEM
jgi:hypothetical protein